MTPEARRTLTIGGIVTGVLFVVALVVAAVAGPKDDGKSSTVAASATSTSSTVVETVPQTTVQPVIATTVPVPTTTVPKATTTSLFFKGKYAQSVQERIDALAAAKDCEGLQNEFDTAEANDAATRSRAGSGTADLMQYIYDQGHKAGCSNFS